MGARAPVVQRRSWLGLALAILVAMALVGAGLALLRFLADPAQLPLRVVEVSGDLRELEPAEIRRVVVDAIDGGFFSCDMQRLRDAVLAMPWVEDVSVRRVWPDRLRMQVVEHQPLARWGDTALITSAGSIFSPQTLSDQQQLVRLEGPTGSEYRVLGLYKAVLPLAASRGLEIQGVQLDERRHWWLYFDGGLTLSVGHEEVERRIAQFFRVYPTLSGTPDRRPERVDMRYAHGFAVRWRVNSAADGEPQGKV